MSKLRRIHEVRQNRVTYYVEREATLVEVLDYMLAMYGAGWSVHSIEYRPKQGQAWWRIGPLEAMEISHIHIITDDDPLEGMEDRG